MGCSLPAMRDTEQYDQDDAALLSLLRRTSKMTTSSIVAIPTAQAGIAPRSR